MFVLLTAHRKLLVFCECHRIYDIHLLQVVRRAEGWHDAVVTLGVDIGTMVRLPLGSRGLEGCRCSHKRRKGMRRRAEEVV
jgi:hypothetical protein